MLDEAAIAQKERSELIGMVVALQREVAELTSPERTRAYTLGRLELLAREKDDGVKAPARSVFPKKRRQRR